MQLRTLVIVSSFSISISLCISLSFFLLKMHKIQMGSHFPNHTALRPRRGRAGTCASTSRGLRDPWSSSDVAPPWIYPLTLNAGVDSQGLLLEKNPAAVELHRLSVFLNTIKNPTTRGFSTSTLKLECPFLKPASSLGISTDSELLFIAWTSPSQQHSSLKKKPGNMPAWKHVIL